MFETWTVYRRIVTLSGSKLCSLTIASCQTYAKHDLQPAFRNPFYPLKPIPKLRSCHERELD